MEETCAGGGGDDEFHSGLVELRCFWDAQVGMPRRTLKQMPSWREDSKPWQPHSSPAPAADASQVRWH